MKKRLKQCALTLFEHQIKFLPMSEDERKKNVEAQRKGLGIEDRKGLKK